MEDGENVTSYCMEYGNIERKVLCATLYLNTA